MPLVSRAGRLKKELGVLGAFSIATGATLSSGFFLLPGLAAEAAGPAVIVSYLLAALPLIPATFCMVELATAMPRAGGAYFFLDRSMGPLVGTIGGIGTWLVLVLKTAFALIGMGAYIHLFYEDLPLIPLAVGLAVLFGVLNLLGAGKTAFLQVGLVSGLLAILAWFIGAGLPRLKMEHFSGFFDAGLDPIVGTSGMVYISYVGVTKVASVAEEIRDPGRNLPRAVFFSMVTAIVVYALGTTVMVGVIPPDQLQGDLTPAATAARVLAGSTGAIVLSVAALIAFSSVANAGILSASRYPLAMSRDHLLPNGLRKLTGGQVPYVSIGGTVAAIAAVILLLDAVKVAKLASAFQLLVFGMVCLAVIVMRESGLDSYQPEYRAPLYPYLQIAGVVLPVLFISDMGWASILFPIALVLGGIWWYYRFARARVSRAGAIFHAFHNLGQHRFEGLDTEFRTILKEKGLRREDPFDEVVTNAEFIEIPDGCSFQDATRSAGSLLDKHLALTGEQIAKEFLEGTSLGATPTAKGGALPHFRSTAIKESILCIARSKIGIGVDPDDPLWGGHAPDHLIHAIFFLVSPEHDPARHLRVLAQLAERMDDDGFMDRWIAAPNELRLKEVLLRDERYLALRIKTGSRAEPLIGRSLSSVDFKDCLVALVLREDETIFPHGKTVLQEGDRLTILGEPKSVAAVREEYVDQVSLAGEEAAQARQTEER